MLCGRGYVLISCRASCYFVCQVQVTLFVLLKPYEAAECLSSYYNTDCSWNLQYLPVFFSFPVRSENTPHYHSAKRLQSTLIRPVVRGAVVLWTGCGKVAAEMGVLWPSLGDFGRCTLLVSV